MNDKLAGSGGPPVVPRPGIARALGIINIALAVMLGAYALYSAFMTLAMSGAGPLPGSGADAPAAGQTTFAAMSTPAMIWFGVIDLATSVPLNVLMFATGIGLLNLRRWGATWWARACWAKIVRVVAVWGYFIFGVVPPLSAGMARSVVEMFRAQKGAVARPMNLEQMTLVYTVMFSAVGATIIVLGVLYPAVSLWLLGRPGVKAALSPSSPEPSDLSSEPSPP